MPMLAEWVTSSQTVYMINLAEVFPDHARAMRTRHITSVLPEETDVDLDHDALAELVEPFMDSDFHLESGATRNRVSSLYFQFAGNDVSVDPAYLTDYDLLNLAESLAELIQPIDQHFRGIAELPEHVSTRPIVHLLAGIYQSKPPRPHFDFRARRAVVSYKDVFLGDFGSLSYKGEYRLPSRMRRFGAWARKLSTPGPELLSPSPEEQEAVAGPTQTVTIEPWNVFHDYPSEPDAVGTKRGLVGVTYDTAHFLFHRKNVEV